jgi:hypothetical protein
LSTPTHKISALAAIAARVAGDAPSNIYSARRAMAQELTKLHTGSTALQKMHATPDPTITPATHTKRVTAAATKLREQAATARGRIHQIAQDRLAELDRQIATKVNLKPNAYAPEIRAVFREKPPEAQQRFLVELATQNRGPELAALLEAPGSVTGMTDEMRNRTHDLIVSTHAREEHEELTELTDAFSAAVGALPVVNSFADAFSDPAKLAEIERGEAAAAEAAAAFESAVS